MIYLSKTYEENVSQEQYKYCKPLVEKLIDTGELDVKYKLLLNPDDVVNIVILSLLKVRNFQNEGEEVIYRDGKLKAHTFCTNLCTHPVKFIRKYTHNVIVQYIENISKLYLNLSMEDRESILFSLGLEFIVNMNLDENRVFMNVMKNAMQRANLKKTYNKNVSI